MADVAKFRGITDDEVVSNYGGGGVEIGTDAIKAGLADAIGSFESTVERMAAGKTSTVRGSKMTQFTQAQLDAALDQASHLGLGVGREHHEGQLHPPIGRIGDVRDA